MNSSSLRCKSQIIQELEGALNSHHVSNNNNTPGFSNTNKNSNSNADAANFKIQKFFQSSNETTKKTTDSESNTKTKKTTKKSLETPNNAPQKSSSIQNFFLKPAAKTVQLAITQPVQDTTSSSQIMSTDDSEDSDAGYKNPQRIRRKKRKNSLRREAVLSVHARKQPAIEEKQTLNLTPSKSSSVKIHTESLILFDEVDVVFREDVGFFSAVNHFIKKSRKPIVLTTNDEFLQDKINLNIEKIQFSLPRVDAGVKFLKSIATMEKSELDTSTAYKIVHDCKCDMRRAMVQLQTLIGTGNQKNSLLDFYKQNAVNGTLNMTKQLNKYAFSYCKHHQYSLFFDSLFSLDMLSKRLGDLFVLDSNKLNSSILGIESLTYDLFLIKDGLSDNSTGASNNSTSFNPFLTQPQIQAAAQFEKNNDHVHNVDRFDLTKFNTTYLKNELLDFYLHFIVWFNENRFIDFTDWFKHGRVNRYGYASSACMNRFAQFTFKFTSNSALSLEYRPYLHEICRIEELKQQSQNKRRYLHYFGNTSCGLTREDYSILAKSSLDEASTSTGNLNLAVEKTSTKMFSDTKLYSDDA